MEDKINNSVILGEVKGRPNGIEILDQFVDNLKARKQQRQLRQLSCFKCGSTKGPLSKLCTDTYICKYCK